MDDTYPIMKTFEYIVTKWFTIVWIVCVFHLIDDKHICNYAWGALHTLTVLLQPTFFDWL